MYLAVRDGFYAVLGVMTFEKMELLGVYWFVVNVRENLAILYFDEEVYNGCPLKLCFIGNFILVSRFWSKLYKSLTFPLEHFQNMKQFSSYLFHDLIHCVLYSCCIFPMIYYRYPSKYA